MVESMTALQAENTRKLDEIRPHGGRAASGPLQKRVTESFKAVSSSSSRCTGPPDAVPRRRRGRTEAGALGRQDPRHPRRDRLGRDPGRDPRPEQYDTNVATIPGSTQRVEYAIRMPGADGGGVWLPIDSKFPGDTYAQDAYASGDAQAVEDARHALELVLRSEARNIREKYVDAYTTAAGILFLPFEGLYAEVVNAGLLEVHAAGLSGQRWRAGMAAC